VARVALHLLIRGRVQGVGFRASCRYHATSAGVDGWVRNLPDGRVEAWLEGEPAAVESVAAWCQRGPRHAAVTGVEVHDETPQGLRGFAEG
jgi:acylphosphatase